MLDFAMKTEGLEVIDQRTCSDGQHIEIHQATLDSRTLWFVVAWPPVRTLAEFNSLQAARDAFDGYSGPR